MSKQVTFDLNEETEIEFKLSVKGTSNLPNVKPVIRFIISENTQNGFALVLPAKSTEEGVAVTIPPMKSFFTEEKQYIGKLEIIVGNRYFAPTAMNIGFTRSLDIQAEQLTKPSSITEKKVRSSIDDIPDDILEALTLETKKPAPKKEMVKKSPAPPNQKKSIQEKTKDKKDSLIKEEFKNLFRDALK